MIKRILFVILFALSSYMASAQYTSVNINTLSLATGTIDMGVDVAIASKWSVGGNILYNPFLNHSTALSFGAKKWRFEPNVGLFWGVHAVFAKYKIKNKPSFAIGGGSTIGYSWILSQRWNFSLEGGLALYYLKEKWTDFGTSPLEDIIINHRKRLVLAPSKIAASFSYLF